MVDGKIATGAGADIGVSVDKKYNTINNEIEINSENCMHYDEKKTLTSHGIQLCESYPGYIVISLIRENSSRQTLTLLIISYGMESEKSYGFISIRNDRVEIEVCC